MLIAQYKALAVIEIMTKACYMVAMKRLADFKHVGWDFDGTLWDHPNSKIFSDFIRQNPYDQKFHIVTFRSHGYELNIDRDLHSLRLRRKHFTSVNNVADVIFGEYHHAIKNGRNQAAVDRYLEWKGRVCHDLGIGILLDDMTDLVIQGCERYDIALIHPDELVDWRIE